jgi:hypothetical protein
MAKLNAASMNFIGYPDKVNNMQAAAIKVFPAIPIHSISASNFLFRKPEFLF